MDKAILAIAALVGAASIALAASYSVLSPSYDTIMPNIPIESQMDMFRANLLPGHSLVLLASYSVGNAVSIDAANPTRSHIFSDCQVIQEIFKPYYESKSSANQTLREKSSLAALNVTLKSYGSMPPLFNDSFTTSVVPDILMSSHLYSNLTEYASVIRDRSWFILECKSPNEIVAYPTVTVGGYYDAVSFHSGDTVTIRGIVGFSSIHLQILKPGRDVFANETIRTGKRGSFVYSFVIPDNAKRLGQEWFIDIIYPDTSGEEIPIRIE